MKKIKIWTFVFVICVLGKAELYAQTVFSEIKPSVNAQQFISAGSANNGLHTGQITVNIPLFNLQAKGVDVPISISYNGAGITHTSEASCIGLGWSLLSGGVITQTIRDMNDLDYAERKTWHYDGTYLQNKQVEQQNNPYSINRFDLAMQYVKMDGEPDIFKYSFLGYSGDICLEYKADGSRVWTMYPDKSFQMEKTAVGFKIVANNGIEYLFEAVEKKQSGSTISITSWFLTKIKTPEGGTVIFEYQDDYSYDLTSFIASSIYETDQSKRITRIDYDYGYVTFISSSRDDKYFEPDLSKGSKRITNIELHNKAGTLIKGFQLDNNGYFYNNNQSFHNWGNTRLKLKGVREYSSNKEFLPYYRFEYDHFFALPKTSLQPSNPFPLPKGTWAHNPGHIASVNRSLNGELNPKGYCNGFTPDGTCIWTLGGFYSDVDPMDGFSLSDYICLTKVDYPTGGSETYYYESHDYGLYVNSNEYLPTFYDQNKRILGKRLLKKEIRDDKGNIQTFIYKYRLHDQNNQLMSASSGVLVNPSIHTTTLYTVGVEDNESEKLLLAFPFKTLNPQNNPLCPPVYYTEIEETQIEESGNVYGKKIYYYERMYALPGTNYVYLNYSPYGGRSNLLIRLPNTLYGKQNYFSPELEGLSAANFTYLAYPLGRFNISHLNEGKLVKEVVLDSYGNIVRKTENRYTDGFGVGKTQFGLLVKDFIDGEDKKRYLIAQTQLQFGVRELVEQTTIHYYQNDSVNENKSFTYTNLNLIKSSTTTSSTGNYLVNENIYPNEIVFQTTNLSAQAASIKKMNDLNMIGIPIQTTTKNGNEFIAGTYKTFKQLPNGTVVTDSVFHLGLQQGASVAPPFVNTNGMVIKNINFHRAVVFSTYDSNVNPTTVEGRDGVKETIVWGYGGKYPIARIVNYTDNQLRNNIALLNQLAILESFTIISESDQASLLNCNKIIRNNLPGDAMVLTYTYSPLVGMTSKTDSRGVTTYYEYDGFRRLIYIKDNSGRITDQYDYHYKQ